MRRKALLAMLTLLAVAMLVLLVATPLGFHHWLRLEQASNFIYGPIRHTAPANLPEGRRQWLVETSRGRFVYERLYWYTTPRPTAMPRKAKSVPLLLSYYEEDIHLWRSPSSYGRRRVIEIVVWPLFVLFSLCPTTAFVRGPVRRWRRRRKGLCIPCGYDLTGNVSGVCPECGSKA